MRKEDIQQHCRRVADYSVGCHGLRALYGGEIRDSIGKKRKDCRSESELKRTHWSAPSNAAHRPLRSKQRFFRIVQSDGNCKQPTKRWVGHGKLMPRFTTAATGGDACESRRVASCFHALALDPQAGQGVRDQSQAAANRSSVQMTPRAKRIRSTEHRPGASRCNVCASSFRPRK